MSKSEAVEDVLCLAVPEEIDPVAYRNHAHTELWDAFIEHLTEIAQLTVWRQWPEKPPVDVKFESMTWLVTNLVEDIASFQPAHDCPECWAGNRRAEIFLLEHPGRWIAMANIHYVTVWEA